MLMMPSYLFLKLFTRGQRYRDGMVGLLKALYLPIYQPIVYAELWELESRPRLILIGLSPAGGERSGGYCPCSALPR